MVHLRVLISLTAGLAALLAAPPALAQQPFAPYDGEIPFNCELQYVGTGTDYPHPEADPFCVEFDKTNQNVTGFGIVEFTAQEPARVAAASSKCFYFQRDHWTGSVVQGSGPETWHWDGDYWYDRARGVGGVSVKNFRIGGQPQDARPYVPAAYRPYFDDGGGGGVMMNMDTARSPDCTAKVDTPEERDRVYANRSFQPGCIDPGGRLRGKRVGKVKLGMRRARVRARLGPPHDHGKRVDEWCLVGKGEIRVAYAPRGAAAILTSGRGHAIHGVSRGDRVRRVHRRLDVLDSARRFGNRVLVVARIPFVWVGLHERRVRWLTIFGRGALADTTLKRLFRDVR